MSSLAHTPSPISIRWPIRPTSVSAASRGLNKASRRPALRNVFVDDVSSSVYKLIKQYKVALPLHPEFGTEPNVFYVPPVLGPRMEMANGELSSDPKIPLAQLEGLFGKQVRDVLAILQTEREKKMKGLASDLMDVLIGRRSADMMISPLT